MTKAIKTMLHTIIYTGFAVGHTLLAISYFAYLIK